MVIPSFFVVARRSIELRNVIFVVVDASCEFARELHGLLLGLRDGIFLRAKL